MAKQQKKLAARLYDAIWPGQPQKSVVKRGYQAAKLNRQNADWTIRPTSENWELRQSLFALRGRSREAARNDPYLSRYLDLTRENVVGPKGIQLQSRATKSDGTLDAPVNKTVEDAWREWGHADTCTITGKLDWKGVQHLVATQVERDGESLVQMIPDSLNPFGFSLKVINVDYLNEFYNTQHTNGNRIIMSVEIDADDKPVAYWLTTPASDVMFAQKRELTRTRVPADQMLHIFVPNFDESQVRGIPAFAPVLLTAKTFQSYLLGVVQSARFASNVFGFIEDTTPDGSEPYTGADDLEGRATDPVIDVSPLSMNELPPNKKFSQIDPKQPTQNHSEFSKRILIEYGAGLGIPYFLLANDWEATNYSSSRGGLDATRDMWREKQQFLASMLCRPVFQAWSRQAFLSGKLEIAASKFMSIQNPEWKGRGWRYVDPVKDIGASVVALENKLSCWTDEYAEQGKDFQAEMLKIKAEQDFAKSIGLDLVAVTTVKVADAGTAPTDEEGKPAPAPASKKAAAK